MLINGDLAHFLARMQGATEHLRELFQGIGVTHKADPDILKSIKVKIDSDILPIEHVALVSSVNGVVKVQPFDRSWLAATYEAIKAGNLGVYPEKTKDSILVKLPQLTGERRQELAEIAKKLAETQRIAVRNIRRDARKAFPDDTKEIEKITSNAVKEIDDALAWKIQKLLKI